MHEEATRATPADDGSGYESHHYDGRTVTDIGVNELLTIARTMERLQEALDTAMGEADLSMDITARVEVRDKTDSFLGTIEVDDDWDWVFIPGAAQLSAAEPAKEPNRSYRLLTDPPVKGDRARIEVLRTVGKLIAGSTHEAVFETGQFSYPNEWAVKMNDIHHYLHRGDAEVLEWL